MDAPVTSFDALVIKEGYMPSTVYRVRLNSVAQRTPRSVIVKCVRPPWKLDPAGAEREYHAYTDLLARIPMPLPKLYHTQLANAEQHTQIVMQDLSPEYEFHAETHAWTWAEAQAILRALVRLHSGAGSLGLAEYPYLMPPLATRWSPVRAREMISDLLNTMWLRERVQPVVPCVELVLGELPHLEKLAAQEPLTLVHYDVYPPNVALLRDSAAPEAVLIDWAAATLDVAEIDLAFLFQQPYKSDRLLDWRTALRYYWQEQSCLTGIEYNWQERCTIFRYARIQALFTTLIAIHRAWEKCEREGTRIAADAPDPYMRFFDAALNSVLDTLLELCEDPLADD